MRSFNQYDQRRIFSLCPTALHKARLLEELDESLIEKVLEMKTQNYFKDFRYLIQMIKQQL